ncbi:MAG: hemerythrin family protein [Deltaproteobacteria bacterium]|nr:hemerythrin family protein [Deltaproteobacteria bacterium]
MALQWTIGLATGNEEIDTQHKELFARVNAFLDAMQQQKGKEEIGNVLKFLENYVVMHFGTEERYMEKIKFKRIAEHKAQHADFIKTFTDIKKKYDLKGPTVDVIVVTQSRLGEWLRSHIPVMDKELAMYIGKGG